MADDRVGRVLVFLEELLGSREGDLVDVFLDIVGVHADATVGDGERAGLFVNFDTDVKLAELALELAERSEGLQLLGGVDGVRHKFAEKNLVVAVEKLFDNGEDIFGSNPDFTFCHIIYD